MRDHEATTCHAKLNWQTHAQQTDFLSFVPGVEMVPEPSGNGLHATRTFQLPYNGTHPIATGFCVFVHISNN